MNYAISFERHHNDYVPIDLTAFEIYQGESLDNLATIDSFTSKMSEEDFREFAKKTNMYSKEELSSPIVISFYSNGRYRKLEDGPIFIEKKDAIAIQGLMNRMTPEEDWDRQTANNLYNAFASKKDQTPALRKFLEILHTGILREENILSFYLHANYDELRAAGIFMINEKMRQEQIIDTYQKVWKPVEEAKPE